MNFEQHNKKLIVTSQTLFNFVVTADDLLFNAFLVENNENE